MIALTKYYFRPLILFAIAAAVFVFSFGFAGDVLAVQCLASNPATPGIPVWNKSVVCDYPITYNDPGGSGLGLATCKYQAINWNAPLNPAGWELAAANPDDCEGGTASMKSGGISIGSAGNCTQNGQDTCWLYWKATDNGGNTDDRLLKSFDVDYSPPFGGSISYTDGFAVSTSVALTVNDGTDAGSGINASTRTVQRKSAALSNGTCGAYGSFASVSVTGTYPSFTNSGLTSGNCYQYQYFVQDNAGNPATYTSQNAVKVDTAKPEIHAFDVVPKIPAWVNASTQNVTVSFELSDAGGALLKDVEVYRENPTGHIPVGWNKIGAVLASVLTLKQGSITNYEGSFNDPASNLLDGKTYRYGIHVNDNAGNVRTEDDNIPADPYVGGPLSVQVDKTSPTVTINRAAGQANPTNASPINFTVVFSEVVANFVTGDVTLSGTAGATTAMVTGSGTTYTVTVSGMISSGTVTAAVGENKAIDAAGNGNTASTENTVTYTSAIVNTPPTISDIANQTTNEDTPTSAIAFTVGDAETAPASLTLTKASSNTTLVPTANIVFGGSGASRTVTITPAQNQSGTSTITVTVSDGSLTASDTFVLTVIDTAVIDATAPEIDSFSANPSTLTINNPTVTIPWSVEDFGGSGLKQVELWQKAPGGSWLQHDTNTSVSGSSASGSFSDTPTSDGTYEYGLHVKDTAGNWCDEGGTGGGGANKCAGSYGGAGTKFVQVDKTPPVTSLTSVAGDMASPYWDTTNNSSTDIVVAGEANMVCRWGTTDVVYSSMTNNCSVSGVNATCSLGSIAQSASYTRYVSCRDAAGNEQGADSSQPTGNEDVTFGVDWTPPDTTITAQPSNPTNSTSASFSFISTETGSTFQCQIYAGVDAGGFSSCTSPKSYTNLARVSHIFEVKATDAAGNTDATPASYTWVIETTPPPTPVPTPTPNRAPSITGNPSGSPDPIRASTQIMFTAQWNDADGDSVAFFACKNDQVPTGGDCSGGSANRWCRKPIPPDTVLIPSGTDATCNGTSPSVGGTYTYYAFVCDDDNACSSSKSGTFLVDATAPTITTFTITPQSPNWANNVSPSIKISWRVRVLDQGGSFLDRVEIFRVLFGPGCNDTDKSGCVWGSSIGSVSASPNNNDWTCNDCFTNDPGSGTWWYGMHVWDKAQNETVEPTPPGPQKALVDTVLPSTAVTSHVAGTWFKNDFNATLDDSDTGGSGLVLGGSGCQYRFIGDNPSGVDISSGDLTRQCDPVTKAITVGASPDVCRFEGANRCRVETQSFDIAGNTSGWKTMLFGVDFTLPIVGSPAPNSAQSGVSTNYSATLRDPIGKVIGCGFYWRAVGSSTWNTGSATTINPIPCENNASCTVSVNHTFASAGNYETQFGCTDQATNTGWGGVTTVQVWSLSVDLSAIPSSGSINTLFDLVGTVSGTMTGNINYKFDCGEDGTGDWELEVNNSTTNPYTAVDLCQYSLPATYTAKVLVQRGVGTAQNTVNIPMSANSIPSTPNLSVDPANPTDYVGVTGYPPVRVRWTFSDADPGDTQSAYEIEVFQGAVKVVDTGKRLGSTQSYVFQSAGEQLLWGTTYAWQVRVWDSHDDVSIFASGPQFTTPIHYYPVPNFTRTPAVPGAQELVQFTDQTNFAAGATGKTWFWTFGDGGSSSMQNPTHTYAQTGVFEVTLQAGDDVGLTSTQKTVNVSVPFPEWQEISPF